MGDDRLATIGRPAIVELPAHGGAAPEVCLVWRLPEPALGISSAVLGGGLGLVSWVVNLTVDPDYHRPDPVAHLAETADRLGLRGRGVGLMTAVDVRTWSRAEVDRTSVATTVGVRRPVWAADRARLANPARTGSPTRPGTVNLVGWLPVRHDDAALVNAVATVTEAKVQALVDHGVPGTGTASDAVCVLCPPTGPSEAYGGPCSRWGAPLALAAYEAVSIGVRRQRG